MKARDRVHLLLDPDTPFLELGCFAGFNLDTSSPAASLITGIGVIWYPLPTEKPKKSYAHEYVLITVV